MFGDFKIFPDGLDLSDQGIRLCVCHCDKPTAILAKWMPKTWAKSLGGRLG